MNENIIKKITLDTFSDWLKDNNDLSEANVRSLFVKHDITQCADCSKNYPSKKKNLIESFYQALDLSNGKDVKKLLNVFKDTMELSTEKDMEILSKALESSGFIWSGGKIIPIVDNPNIQSLEEIAEKYGWEMTKKSIENMRNSQIDDPELAIGTAKELLETCCKTILSDLGKEIDKNWDLLKLCKEARDALSITPEDIKESQKGKESIKKILGNLGGIVQGIAEIRNLYGTGHGKEEGFIGLKTLHAELMVGATTTLVLFLYRCHKE
jgi:hypothetical protein